MTTDPVMTADRNTHVTFDAVRLEILWQRLLTIVEEAAWGVIRTSFSVAVREGRDFGCGIYDANGRMLAMNMTEASKSIVYHTVIAELLELYPPSTINPGDVFITNDPWLGEGHLYDTTVAAPIFHCGRLVGFAEASAHLSDIGGSVRSDAHEIYEEGLQIPLVRFRSAGTEESDLIRFIETNVRTPAASIGDVRALVVSLDIIAESVEKFLSASDLPDLADLADAIVSRTAEAMRAGIRDVLDDGRYTYEIRSDGYKQETVLKVTAIVEDDRLVLDFSGSSAASEYGVNCTLNYVYRWATFAVKALVCPDGHVNEGTFEPVEVSAPDGSLLKPRRPAPVRMRAATGQLVPPLVFGALAQASKRPVATEGSAPLWIQRIIATTATGRRVAEMLMTNGGTGARATADGKDTLAMPSNSANTPVEILESVFPITVVARELRPDSGGAGEFRGGNGQRVVFRVGEGASVRALFQHERHHHPARGMNGGSDGAVGRTLVNGTEVPAITDVDLHSGDEVVLELPGGGGWGSPRDRARARIELDLEEGLISWGAAADIYGMDRPEVEQ